MFRYSLNLVLRRKLRTVLTSLGIAISVVLLGSIIFGMSGLRNVITDEFTTRFKPTQIAVTAQSNDFLDLFSGGGEEESPEVELDENGLPIIEEIQFLTPEIIQELEEVENVDSVEPQSVITGMQIVLEGESKEAFSPSFIAGVDNLIGSDYIVDYEVEKEVLAEGEAYASVLLAEYYGIEPMELIGRTVRVSPATDSFFSIRSTDILDKSYTFEIVGYIDPGIDRFDLALTLDAAAAILADVGGFVDGDAYLAAFGYEQIIVNVNDEDNVAGVKDIIENQFGFSALTSEDVIDFLGQITTVLTLALTAFGIISAAVASIGIINTMVMSIYEQTREIGIIKSLGSSNRQVLIIFLIQSGTIGLIGGVVGLIVLGLIMLASNPFIVDLLQDEGFTATNFYTVDIPTVVGIVAFSIIVGLIAGIYPALKAARLDPVKALRYE